jgi:hypothetical protein
MATIGAIAERRANAHERLIEALGFPIPPGLKCHVNAREWREMEVVEFFAATFAAVEPMPACFTFEDDGTDPREPAVNIPTPARAADEHEEPIEQEAA